MTGRYDLNGNVYLERNNGEILKLSYAESIEIFATVADVRKMPFDKDLIYYQMANALELEV